MRRHRPSCVASLSMALVALVVTPVLADRGGFVIRSFDTDLTIEADADLLVQERIQVEFLEPRHGIYRTIPVRYTDPMGYAYSLGFRLDQVLDESGRSHRTKVTGQGRYVKIRIGDPDRTVHGRVVYVIRYRIRDALGHFPDHDELYWNATGHEWQTRIERASATVRFPVELEDDALELAGYTGRFGSRAQNVRISRTSPDLAYFESTGPLGPLEGLTVVAAFPRGHVTFPSAATRILRFLGSNWILAAPLLALALLWRTYLRRGRDPAGPGSVVVRYEPPEGMTPGEIGTLVDERVDLRDITATVVDLAVRGYLKIRVEEKSALLGLLRHEEVIFERDRSVSRESLAAHERRIGDALFATGDVVEVDDLKNRFYKDVPGIRKAFYARLVERGFFTGNPEKVRRGWLLAGVAVGIAVFGLGAAWASWRGLIFPNAMVVPAAVGVVTFALFAAFSRAMPRRTRRGVEMRSWARGFEEFVDRVESERIEADRRRNVFESLLPYAMALGVAAAWARRFEGLYEQAAPGWYVGARPGSSFSTGSLERGLSAAMTRAAEGMTTRPRSSSGSGGGGFSGGGGGGGGGGSW